LKGITRAGLIKVNYYNFVWIPACAGMTIIYMSDFQQTVDLREQVEKRRLPQKKAAPPPASAKLQPAGLEKIFEEPSGPKKDLKTISQPRAGRPKDGLFRLVVFSLAVIVVGVTVYWLFFRHESATVNSAKGKNWYVVTLKTNDEMYYGQIGDTKANPVELTNVYENYDQYYYRLNGNKKKETTATSTILSLIKRSEEPNGPGGNMLIYQTEIKTVDKLADGSKVKTAIMEHENK
jgi:hypothetical protein